MTPEEVEQLAAYWTAAQRTVAAFVRTLIIDFHDAEYVLQRVAVALVRKFSQYDPQRPFVAWAIGVAKHECLAFLRQHRRERLLFDDELLEKIAECHHQEAQSSSPFWQFLEECIQELAGRAKRAIQLRYVNNLKTAEIAEKMCISPGAARMLLSRARALLRECLEAHAAQHKENP